MDTTAFVSAFRSEVNDLAEPYLWSDEEVISFANEAQKTFCRKTDGIADASTPEVTQLAITTGQAWVPLHKGILKIRAATFTSSGRDVAVVNQEDMPRLNWRFDGRTAPLLGLVIGMEAHKARTYPLPSENVSVELLVYRLPLLDLVDFDQDFEIDPEHHRSLLHWAKHLAYNKQDAETFDKLKAVEFEGRFLAYCAQVKEEERRKAFKPRVVTYGGL